MARQDEYQPEEEGRIYATSPFWAMLLFVPVLPLMALFMARK